MSVISMFLSALYTLFSHIRIETLQNIRIWLSTTFDGDDERQTLSSRISVKSFPNVALHQIRIFCTKYFSLCTGCMSLFVRLSWSETEGDSRVSESAPECYRLIKFFTLRRRGKRAETTEFVWACLCECGSFSVLCINE